MANAALLTIHRTGGCHTHWLPIDSGSAGVASEALVGLHCQRLEFLNDALCALRLHLNPRA